MLRRFLVMMLVVVFAVSVGGVVIAIEWNSRAATSREVPQAEATATPEAVIEVRESETATRIAIMTEAQDRVTVTTPEESRVAIQVEDTEAGAPPEFINRDPELRETYERAREIYTDPNETEESRGKKIRVLQRNVGAEAVTLVLRYVPVVDLEDGTVRTFDSHMREMAETYDSERGSPIDRDPVGATMKILFDPSPETIRSMTGIGVVNSKSSQQQEDDDWYEEEQRRSREERRRYEQEQAREEVEQSWEDVQESWEDAEDAVEEAVDTFSDIINSWGEDK